MKLFNIIFYYSNKIIKIGKYINYKNSFYNSFPKLRSYIRNYKEPLIKKVIINYTT